MLLNMPFAYNSTLCYLDWAVVQRFYVFKSKPLNGWRSVLIQKRREDVLKSEAQPTKKLTNLETGDKVKLSARMIETIY